VLGVVVVASAAASGLVVPARASLSAPGTSIEAPLAGKADLREALRLERALAWHTWNRQIYDVDFVSNLRDPEEQLPGVNEGAPHPGVAQITDTTDSGLWTGAYLASLGFRFQVASHHASDRRLTPAERAFWQRQRDDAVATARPLIEQYHLKIHISQAWTAPPPAPERTSTSPDGSGNIDTGVAPFPGGEPGLLFRTCIPSDAPARLSYARRADNGAWEKDTVYGPLLWDPDGDGVGRTYDCEDGTSRDTYAGTTFGLVTAFDLFGEALGPAEAGGTTLHRQIGEDLMLLTDFLVRHGWSTPRPHSKVSTRNDLSSFYSPLFLYTPGAKVHMAQVARHVADEMGSLAQRAEFDALWAGEANTDAPTEAFSTELDAADKLSQYYKWNLGHLIAFDLVRLAGDPLERARLKQAIATMDANTRDDGNAHFEAITFSMTGEPRRLQDSILHLRQWRDWRARDEVAADGVRYQTRYNSERCGTELACVAQGYKTLVVRDATGGEVSQTFTVPPTPDEDAPEPDFGDDCQPRVVYYPSNCRARDPLPVVDRTMTDFLWQRSPFVLDGDRRATHEASGIDYLLPYWMLRYLTEVRPPALEPFPTYVGPFWR
jgi:hypothetical protein